MNQSRGHEIAAHSEPPRRSDAVPPPPPAGNPTDRLLTYDAVMVRLSCRRDHIFALVREGRLPVTYIGPRQPRISERALADFIANNTVPAAPREGK